MMEELKAHLMQRPFARIFDNIQNNEEKDDLVALQVMCILDFQAETMELYKRIEETGQPKLLLDLMRFRSYKSFIYYEYQGHGQLDGKYLKCRYCELYGSYVLILTHMTINHDEHIGSVKCAYCNQIDLKKHFNDGTMQTCYERYLRKPDVMDTIQDDSTSKIVADFYAFLKILSINLGIFTRRTLHTFTGTAYGALELINKRSARAAKSYEVIYRQRRIRKTISTEKLGTLANQVWLQFYGRLLPIVHFQNDNDTRERSTRLNNRRSGLSQNDNSETSTEEPTQSEMELSGFQISRPYSLGEAATSSPALSAMSTSTNDTAKTAEAKFGEYVAHRLELQSESVKRRRLEAAIQRTISNFEIDQLENE